MIKPQRRLLRRPDAGEHGRLRSRRAGSSRASTRRRPTPRRRPTSTARCPTSAASCTRTRRTPRPGPARGEAMPCVLTMWPTSSVATIPVGPFAIIGDDSIGRGIVETLRGHRSQAVLMRNHGVFTIGATAQRRGQGGGDVRGRRPHRAHRRASSARRSRSTADDIDALYDRYQNVYGQSPPGTDPEGSHDALVHRASRGLVPHRQPGDVRPGDARPGRSSSPRASPRRSPRHRTLRSASCGSRCCSTRPSIHRADARGQQRDAAASA